MGARGGKLRTASWILLTFVGSVVLFFSCVSAWLAYSGADFPIAGEPVAEVAGGRAEIETGLRAIRGTAAAFAAAFAVLIVSIAAGPYRLGTRWSWWTILGAYLALLGFVLARIPALGTHVGVGAATVPAALVVLALLLDVGRLRSPSDP